MTTTPDVVVTYVGNPNNPTWWQITLMFVILFAAGLIALAVAIKIIDGGS